MTQSGNRLVGSSRSCSRWSAPIAGMLACAGLLASPSIARGQSIDTVVQWNRVLLTAITTPGAQPPTVFFTRSTALVSAAVFDAANSFDRIYHPAFVWVNVPAGASRDAAVAQAAHDALVSEMPSQTAVYDSALAMSLAGIPAQAAADGAAVGAAAAKAVIEARTGDGWERPFSPLVLPSRRAAARRAECVRGDRRQRLGLFGRSDLVVGVPGHLGRQPHGDVHQLSRCNRIHRRERPPLSARGAAGSRQRALRHRLQPGEGLGCGQ